MNEIIFNPKDHTYTYGETPVPSVTTLIRYMSDDPYKGIPKKNLENAAKYGDKVHELIERYALGKYEGTPEETQGYEGIALRRFYNLAEKHDIIITSCEERLVYLDSGLPLYCGMYDMLGTVEEKLSLIDIKTTAEVHYPQLELQLAMYKAAIEQMFNNAIEETYCLWLPKKKLGKLIKIDIPKFDSVLDRARAAYAKSFGN